MPFVPSFVPPVRCVERLGRQGEPHGTRLGSRLRRSGYGAVLCLIQAPPAGIAISPGIGAACVSSTKGESE